MAKHNLSAYVQCPFFHYYDGCKISCEGVKKNSALHLVFASPDERRKYMKSTCYFNHYDCLVAQMLYVKYDDIKEV